MALYFVDPANGNDTNDGLDFVGLTLVSADYDHTGNGEGERHLESTGDFSAYTFSSGDKIYLLNAIGGVVEGLYEIASKVDADAILLVADAGLTADSTGDVDSSSGAWLTTQKAADTVIAGDEIRLMTTATETPAARVDFDGTTGTLADPIRYFAADSSGDRLTSGVYTINGGSLPATTDLVAFHGGTHYLIFEHVRITEATRDNIVNVSSWTGPYVLKNCRVDTAARHGFYNTSTSGLMRLLDCEVDSCIGLGIDVNSANRGPFHMYGGSIHDNLSGGVRCGEAQGTEFRHVAVYDNTGIGIQSFNVVTCQNCVFTANTNHGLQIKGFESAAAGEETGYVLNNTFTKNGGYGINVEDTTDNVDLALFDYNHFGSGAHANTSGETNLAATPGLSNQTGDPLFTEEDDGIEDFTPLTGSPLIGTGLNGSNIGTKAHADGGGGGGDPGPVRGPWEQGAFR